MIFEIVIALIVFFWILPLVWPLICLMVVTILTGKTTQKPIPKQSNSSENKVDGQEQINSKACNSGDDKSNAYASPRSPQNLNQTNIIKMEFEAAEHPSNQEVVTPKYTEPGSPEVQIKPSEPDNILIPIFLILIVVFFAIGMLPSVFSGRTTEVRVTDQWFFIGRNGDDGQIKYIRSPTESVEENQRFGCGHSFRRHRGEISYRVELSAPSALPVQNITQGDAHFSKDRTIMTIQGEIDGKDESFMYWLSLGRDDPKGYYELTCSLGGHVFKKTFFHKVSDGGLCPQKQNDINSPAPYLAEISESLWIARTARDSVKERTRKATSFSDIILSLKISQQYYDCAKSHIAPFTQSSNETISTTADGIEKALETFSNLNTLFIDDIKSKLNDLESKKDFSRNLGEEAEESADIKLIDREAGLLLTSSIAMATHAAIKTIEKEKKVVMLLTKHERKEIVEILDGKFGKIKKNDLRYFEVSAKLLRRFLMGNWD